MNTRTMSGALVIRTLPALVSLIALVLVISFVALMLTMAAGYRAGSDLLRTNPFAAYTEVWVGQSIYSVAAYGRRTPNGPLWCTTGTSPSQTFQDLGRATGEIGASGLAVSMICGSSPRDDIFRQLTLLLDHDTVQSLTLDSDVLQMDALFLYWDAPDAMTRSEDSSALLFRWEREKYVAVAQVRVPEFVAEQVSIWAKGQP